MNPVVFPNINLIPAYPEIFLLVAASAVLLVDMFVSDGRRLVTYWLSIGILAICAVLNALYLIDGSTWYTFGNMFVALKPLSER